MICGIWNPDPGDGKWCLVCDQGGFDSVVLQSDNKQLLEANRPFFLALYDRPLEVIPLANVRNISFDVEEFLVPIGPGCTLG